MKKLLALLMVSAMMVLGVGCDDGIKVVGDMEFTKDMEVELIRDVVLNEGFLKYQKQLKEELIKNKQEVLDGNYDKLRMSIGSAYGSCRAIANRTKGSNLEKEEVSDWYRIATGEEYFKRAVYNRAGILNDVYYIVEYSDEKIEKNMSEVFYDELIEVTDEAIKTINKTDKVFKHLAKGKKVQLNWGADDIYISKPLVEEVSKWK